MNKPQEILKLLKKYVEPVDNEIKSLLSDQNDYLIYDMMSYFFGFKDETLKDISSYGGKRFRSGLCILIADFYGKADKALEVATSIEIFHNFTLIHDDIEDRDALRRGKPTVWKIWGINHGINTGDSQMILANIELTRALERNNSISNEIIGIVNKKYLEVIEGQFLDFCLEDLSIEHSDVNANKYLEMISKKSAVLVGTPAMAAGIVSGKANEEQGNLWDYGFNLGMAYQLRDDLASIWACEDETGKAECKDIKEKKKTLPIIYLFEKAADGDKEILSKIYHKENITDDDVEKIKILLEKYEVYNYVWDIAMQYLEKSLGALEKLEISNDQKQILKNINNALISDVKETK